MKKKEADKDILLLVYLTCRERALNDSMTNLMNTGVDHIYQRLDELQAAQQPRPRTGTRSERSRRSNRSDDEPQEDDDRSINRPRRGQRNRDQGDVNPFC